MTAKWCGVSDDLGVQLRTEASDRRPSIPVGYAGDSILCALTFVAYSTARRQHDANISSSLFEPIPPYRSDCMDNPRDD